MTSEPYVPGLSGELPNVATYRGDRVTQIMGETRLFGPGRGGRRYSAVDARYNPATDTTRVQFQPITLTERPAGQPIPEEFGALTRQQRRQLERENTPKRKRRR